jgi:hypothetical protein
MHDHHPRYDRSDIGVRRPGKVYLPEEREPERRGMKRLHWFVLLLLLAVGLTVLYFTLKDRFTGGLKTEAAPVLLDPETR